MNTLNDQYVSAIAAVHKIIPDDERAVVIARGQKYSTEKWWWGDRTNKWVTIVLAAGEKLTIGDAQRAISQDSGIPHRTLRHFADHARFFDLAARSKYEILPFSHFTIAKKYSDDWEEILKESLIYLERFNKLPSSDYLDWWFSLKSEPVKSLNNDLQGSQDVFDQTYDLDAPFIDPESLEPRASQAAARDWIDTIDQKVRAIEKSIEPLPVSDRSKTRLRYALANLNQALEEAYKEISVPNPTNMPPGRTQARPEAVQRL